VVSCADARHPMIQAMIGNGELYQQGLSSVLVPLLLDVKAGHSVLDLCAAPGSKTSQIAALMGNVGILAANEPIRARYYKLKSVLALMGVVNARLSMVDGRRFRSVDLFDRVLVDAPCSSESRFRVGDMKSFGYWSERKINEMAKKQRGLLLNAFRLLKPGGTLIYATCSFAPEENEAVVDWFLRKVGSNARLMDCRISGVESYPALTEWRGKGFHPETMKIWRVLPGTVMSGFTIAKIHKLGNHEPMLTRSQVGFLNKRNVSWN
jgi:tRNA (cytosine49-C5)-methyltransferase